MKTKNSANIFIEVTKSIMVLLFCYTAFSKILTFDQFVFQLEKSPLIPITYGEFYGLGVIVTELIASYLLIFKPLKGFYLSLFLMTSFTAYLFIIINFSFYIPCSCGGILEQLDWNTHIILNISLILLIILSILFLNTYSHQTRSLKYA